MIRLLDNMPLNKLNPIIMEVYFSQQGNYQINPFLRSKDNLAKFQMYKMIKIWMIKTLFTENLL